MLSIVFWTATVSGTISSSRIFTPGQLGQRGRALGVGLVVAVVGLGTDVDEADRQRRRRAVGDVGVGSFAPHAQNDGDRGEEGEALPDGGDDEGDDLSHGPLIGRVMLTICFGVPRSS